MSIKYFFDVPVYRLDRDKYYQEQKQYVDSILFPKDSPDYEALRAQDKADPSKNDWFKNYAFKSYGGCWEFNEIIGYIRLHFLGSQVRGEYFGVNKKRIVRTRTKILEYKTWKLAPEVDVPYPLTQSGILAAIREYIKDCKKELPNRYIDDSMFEAIAEQVDWVIIFKRESCSIRWGQ